MAQERSFPPFLEKSLVPLCGSQVGNVSHFGSMTLAGGEALQDPRNQKTLWAQSSPCPGWSLSVWASRSVVQSLPPGASLALPPSSLLLGFTYQPREMLYDSFSFSPFPGCLGRVSSSFTGSCDWRSWGHGAEDREG